MKAFLTALSLFVFGVLQAQTQDELRLRQALSLAGDQIRAYLTLPEKPPVPDNLSDFPLNFTLAGEELKLRSLEQFKDTGNPLALMFVVDISRSMDEKTFLSHRGALMGWLQGLKENDTVALMTVGNEAKLIQDFSTDHQTLKRSLQKLLPTDENTRLHRGLKQAMGRIRGTDHDLPERKVIIVLSDGEDDAIGDVSREEVLEAIKSHRVPIYAIGFFRAPLSSKRKKSLKKLGEFSRSSGGDFVQVDGPVEKSYALMQEALHKTWVAELRCRECPESGGTYVLKSSLKETDQIMEDQILIHTQKVETNYEKIILFLRKPSVLVTASIVAIFLLILFFFRRKKLELPAVDEKLESAQSINTSGDDEAEGVSNVDEEQNNLRKEELEQAVSQVPQLRLVGVRGVDLDQTFHVEESLIIGRSENQCGLSLTDDPEVSRKHCELFIGENGKPIILDLDSSNGTFVNGVRIQSNYPLEINDIITIGRVEIRLVSLILPS